MPDWSAVEASFLRQSQPKQLGELASSLARLKSWSQKTTGREIVPILLSECLLYVNLLQKQNHGNNAELAQLQKLLQEWVSHSDNPSNITNLASVAAAWSERVLDMSGLLLAADSMSA